jgi:hypothetical protein
MVERRKQLRRMEWRVVGGDEAEMARGRGHRGEHHGRVVAGKLHGVPDTGLGAAAVDVVGAMNVGEENRIEASAFKRLREFDPMACAGVALRGAILRISILPERLQCGRALIEGVEMDQFTHAGYHAHAGRDRSLAGKLN